MSILRAVRIPKTMSCVIFRYDKSITEDCVLYSVFRILYAVKVCCIVCVDFAIMIVYIK